MDIQQLELVMNTILKLGEAGGVAFYAWLFLDKLVPTIAWLIAFFMCYKLALLVHGQYLVVRVFQQIRDLLNIGSTGYLVDSEIRAVYEKVVELHQQSKSK